MVSAIYPLRGAFPPRGKQPAPMVWSSEQRGEASTGVEAWNAQPINRAIEPDKSRRLVIANEGILFDWKSHGLRLLFQFERLRRNIPAQVLASVQRMFQAVQRMFYRSRVTRAARDSVRPLRVCAVWGSGIQPVPRCPPMVHCHGVTILHDPLGVPLAAGVRGAKGPRHEQLPFTQSGHRRALLTWVAGSSVCGIW